MDAAALAINEQRFASNIKNVVSTDEFGSVAEGNVAEFLKFMPGITIDYTGGNARDVSINGVPSAYVPITVDGFNVASAAGRATARNVQADMVSINNLSRIEVSYSPTPESQGSALAGSGVDGAAVDGAAVADVAVDGATDSTSVVTRETVEDGVDLAASSG